VAEVHVHHLNCGTMCPRGQRLINGVGSLLASGRLVCHVLLIEGPDGLSLVDTGFGMGDVRNRAEMNREFRSLTRPRLDEAETALSQVRRLGFDPGDVRHIVLTHLDIDHGGGLPDFPQAQVHLWERELLTMQNPPPRERRRYRISESHWAHGPRWATHEFGDDRWLGFESVRILPDSAAEILLIPLPGHTFGHTGVAVRQDEGWLLHCGDAYFFRGDIETPRRCPAGLRAFQSLVQADGKLRHQNQERLRELASRHSDEVTLICSHDPIDLDRAPRAYGQRPTPDSTAADTRPTGRSAR
jgi:glyoxylase-like metal-dependent hydrolase (beta-lactamase superfamily II)